ncbi:MAG: alpha-1,2-fucosyltransferase [Alphaproteobacteria bacterium]|nr:alpha-1,2-fucosyltransferase [Alphaproteobacteria bacterium]
MITFSRLGRQGNLGNSMFQLAATIGVAVKNGYEVKMPRHPTYFDTNYNSNNVSVFDGFDIDNIPVLTDADYQQIKQTYTEPHFHYDSNIFNIKDNTDLSGYFQSEKYFIHARKEIKDTLKYKSTYVAESDSIFKQFNINPEETTSIHIRRGDYVQKQAFHPLQDNSYFEYAFKKAKLKYILVFSDDIAWCEQNIVGKNIFYSKLSSCFSDLRAMSLCKNNIIVNSTFGWWGGWLNSHPDKVVVAPKKWFGVANSHLITEDIIPQAWLKI